VRVERPAHWPRSKSVWLLRLKTALKAGALISVEEASRGLAAAYHFDRAAFGATWTLDLNVQASLPMLPPGKKRAQSQDRERGRVDMLCGALLRSFRMVAHRYNDRMTDITTP
jgi:hypothetical protein